MNLIDWDAVEAELSERGCAVIPRLLGKDACAQLASSYDRDEQFRNRIVMARHGFGRGEYRYFAYPLPAVVGALRTALYPRLAPIANRWEEMLGHERRFPAKHADFLKACREAGQARPTPLLLRYGPGDYNCLHQDLYGAQVFPLQVAILLSAPGKDFTGGEFVMTEQRPRMQSRVEVAALEQGSAAVFAVNERPGARDAGAFTASGCAMA